MTPVTPTEVPRLVRGLLPDLNLSVSSVPAAPSTPAAGPDILVVPVLRGASGPEIPVTGTLGEEARLALWKTAVWAGITGRSGETSVQPAVDGVPAARVVTAGLGPADHIAPDTVRQAAGDVSRLLRKLAEQTGVPSCHAVSLLGDLTGVTGAPSPAEVVTAATEGHALGGYLYSGHRSGPAGALPGSVTLVCPDLPGMDAAFTRACTVVEAVACARDLVNAPAGDLGPDSYARIIGDLASASGVEVEVLDETDLEEQGYGGLLAVGRGSARPPRLVRMRYLPEQGAQVSAGLVGKGVTFDTGGISLKKPAGMDAMISDMAGSAAVVAAVLAAAELELPVSVTATLPLVENMPDGDALRPGDIVRHYDGTTSEIVNTDAEGRLILADALARAVEDSPDVLVDVATLTGAQVVSLGDRVSAVMGTPSLRDRIAALARRTGEDAWSMPLPDDVADGIRSDVADLRNTGRLRQGGMAAAGLYLRHFVTPEDTVGAGIPWAHLDVAGPAYNTGTARGYTPARGTGVPVRTLIALLESLQHLA
ncbi:leucyl aminopeptidase [Corynebacterium neomassiliense]|uniref:leucyl aminopeptidase n=1 Tax=Corynebacterium neomassiliense TaxID=2079482 RepID=UPI001030233A|nr:leucyl aminopeptidase [Corynebacterium neomassiliense]